MNKTILIMLVLFSLVSIVVIADNSIEQNKTCIQKTTFLERLQDTCSISNNSICEDAELPLSNDCPITMETITCNGTQCIFTEIWFAKLILLLIVIGLLLYKPPYLVFLIIGILFLSVTFLGISVPLPEKQVDVMNSSIIPESNVIFTQEQINDNPFLKYGLKLVPKNPNIGITILVIASVMIIIYLFKSTYTKPTKKWR